MKTFTIGTNDANQRFDKYLKNCCPMHRSVLYKMLRKRILLWTGKSDREGDAAKGAQVAVFFSDETLHKFMQDTKNCRKSFTCCSVCQ